MKTNYWIVKLGALQLLELMHCQGRDQITGMTYLEATVPARLMIAWFTKLKWFRFPLRHVESRNNPSGPRFNMANVRNDNGETLIIPLYHQVLAMRRRIWAELMETFHDALFFKNASSMNMLAATFGMKIAEEITPTVYLAHYARWGNHRAQGAKNILIIPDTDWSSFLAAELSHLLDRVIIGKKGTKANLILRLRVLWHGAICRVRAKQRPGLNQSEAGGQTRRVLVTYAMGIRENRRNDIPYVHASGMDPARLVFWVQYGGLLPGAEELEWMKLNRAACYASSRIGPSIPGVKKWRSSAHYKELFKDFCRIYLETARQCLPKHHKNTLWLLDHYWKIGKDSVYWKDLFISENIRIIISQIPASENFIPSLAMSEIGGIAAYMERSILFEYCTFIDNAPNHLRFVTGPYSLSHMPEPSFTQLAVQTGALNIANKRGVIPGITKLRGTSRVIIAVFDEMPNEWYFGDSIEQMYQIMIDLVDNDDRFGLLVKTKKPAVLERLTGIAGELERLQVAGRCLVADWTVPCSAAAAQGDIAVGVPSTAVFESLLIGTRTVVFNPMCSGARIFYKNNGLNRRIFEDGENLLAALRRHAGGTDDSVGDCSDLVPRVDSFNDGRGGERMGKYVQCCLDGFDAGLDRGQAIARANERYAEAWGRDKLDQKNVYQALGKFHAKN